MDRDLNDDNKVLKKLDADGNTQGKNATIGNFLRTSLMLKFPDMLRYVSFKKNMSCDVDFFWPYDKYKRF